MNDTNFAACSSKRTPGSLLRWLVSLTLVTATTLAAAAPTIRYTATDLVDVNPGHDLWRYDYTIGGTLAAGFGVNLLFPAASFDAVDVTVPDPNLLTALTPGIPGLADGLLSIVALQDISDTSPAQMSVEFEWLGGATPPSSQSFDVVDDQFSVIGQGRTTPQGQPQELPEPATASLVCAALLGVTTRKLLKSGEKSKTTS